MSAGNFFAQYARDYAHRKEGQSAALVRERDELRSKLAKVEADLSVAQSAAARGSMYPITAEADLCPVCWVNEKSIPIRAMGGGTDSADFFPCGICGTEFEVPFR
jgi:hypothetical protein